MSLRAWWLRNCFWIKDALNGAPIGKQYREIKYIQEHSAEVGEPIRREALHRLLRFAQTNTVFYSKFKSLELSDYPVMNKLELIKHTSEIKVPEAHIPDQKGPVYVQKTSGSTGTPFTIWHSSVKRQRRIAELKYFGKIVGFNSHDKLVQLRAWNRFQSKTVTQGKKENIVPFDISRMGDEDLAELFKIIYSEKAVCIRSYASSFKLIADYARRHPETCGKKTSVKICIAGSEMLEDTVRPLARQYIGGDIISQYADEECGILAQERVPTKDEGNVMYLNHASYFVEVLKMDSDEPAAYGELGRIVLTDLYNYAFPVIRYDDGDVGMLLPPDEHSRGYPVLGKLFGRRMDLIYATDGRALHPMAFGREFKHHAAIAQWQFVQKNANRYLVKIILAKGACEDEVLNIRTPLQNIIGKDAIIDFEFVSDIPVLASGKRKMVVNEWKK